MLRIPFTALNGFLLIYHVHPGFRTTRGPSIMLRIPFIALNGFLLIYPVCDFLRFDYRNSSLNKLFFIYHINQLYFDQATIINITNRTRSLVQWLLSYRQAVISK